MGFLRTKPGSETFITVSLWHKCSCFFAILRLGQLLLNSCFELQPGHTVTRCRIAELHIGSSVTLGSTSGYRTAR